ncbi:L-sorbosone dehydrogenase [Fulvivirga imtechensis AK7]|uniref:L-sorbosone dehydrogenase n=1 Tax=Fulvivirga imtechensis AK7 TaxID=1237149 RepID=L8JX95_9BACT|nr:sorbosone dehydrogenase family protein [Fulvivirga imtechensis]ELR73410.1 L-sorbosone dehydrogenase [Fulvivirga imtechensis AK7]
MPDDNPNDTLPPPYATKQVMNFSHVTGWKGNRKPQAPEGFTVDMYADKLENPRWMYVTPNGDVLVAESNSNYGLIKKIGAVIIGAHKSKNLKKSADRITLLRDSNNDGIPEVRTTFLKNLNQPFGMLVLGDWFYVANTDAVWRYPYKAGQTNINEKGEKITDLPAGKHNQHWTRNIIANEDGSKIYIAVGSGSNVAEHGLKEEFLKASILEINPDGSELKVYASGLRNPVGMDWLPGTDELWTVVNERDMLGDELVPDYLTHVKEGAFYGWPYVYLGQHDEPRVKEKPPIVENTVVPDLPLLSHTASLGLVFYDSEGFPEKYHGGAFIAQHGSWNRSTLSGYKVIFVPFDGGKPVQKSEDFLTGFIDNLNKEKVYGRPVGVTVLPDGNLLVTDDVTGIIWRVSH